MKRRLLAVMLAVCVSMAFMPMLPGGQASAVTFIDVQDNSSAEMAGNPGSGNAFSLSTSSAQYIRFTPEDWPKTTRSEVFLTAISCGGTPKVVQVDSSGNEIPGAAVHDMWGGHTMEPIVITRNEMYDPYPYVYFKITGGLGSKFSISSYPFYYNQSKDRASEILDDTSVKGFNVLKERETGNSDGTLWYKLTALEKAKYRISTTAKKYYYCIGNGDAVYVPDGSEKTVTVSKGQTLYIEIVADKKKCDILTIERDIFNRMTSMKFNASTYNVPEGTSKTISLNYAKLDPNKSLESTIVSFDSGGGCKLTKGTVGQTSTSFTLTGKNPGKYTIQAKNSEGVTATAVVNVVPKKMIVAGASSEGTWKSSVITFGSQIGAKKYAIYLRNSSGQYVYKGMATTNKYNVTGLKANKTYYVKIAPVASGTFKGSAYNIYGPQSDAIKIITAPAKAPVIKKAKATGTKYHKATRTYHSGRWDAGGVWHSGYYTKNPAYSSAAVKVTYTKVKGATSYASNGMSFKKNIAGYTIAGKVKAGKKVKVKVRAVKKSGSSIAYGPWSKAKTVKLKKAK